MSAEGKLNLGRCEGYPEIAACVSDYSKSRADLEAKYIERLKEAYLNHARHVSVGLNQFGETPRPELPNAYYFSEKLKRAQLYLDVMEKGGYVGVKYPTTSSNPAEPQIDDVLVWIEDFQKDEVTKVSVDPNYAGNNGDKLFQIPLNIRDNSPIQVTGHLVLPERLDFRLPHYFELSNCSPSVSIIGVLARNRLNPKAFYMDYLARDTARTRDLVSFRVVLKRQQRDDTAFPGCTLSAHVVPSVDCYERQDRPACYDKTFGQCRWLPKSQECVGANYVPW